MIVNHIDNYLRGRDNDSQLQIGDRMAYSVQNGSIPTGWYDTLEDESHDKRIIEYVGEENPDPSLRILIDTTITGNGTVSETDQFAFNVSGSGFDFEVDWGDGTVEQLNDSDQVQLPNNGNGFLHTYATAGQYEIV